MWEYVRIWKQIIKFNEQTTSADIYSIKFQPYLSAIIKYTPADFSCLQSAVLQSNVQIGDVLWAVSIAFSHHGGATCPLNVISYHDLAVFILPAHCFV